MICEKLKNFSKTRNEEVEELKANLTDGQKDWIEEFVNNVIDEINKIVTGNNINYITDGINYISLIIYKNNTLYDELKTIIDKYDKFEGKTRIYTYFIYELNLVVSSCKMYKSITIDYNEECNSHTDSFTISIIL